jgi:hypothetical protein
VYARCAYAAWSAQSEKEGEVGKEEYEDVGSAGRAMGEGDGGGRWGRRKEMLACKRA